MINSIDILNIPIKKVKKDQFLNLVKEIIKHKQKLQVATVNAEFLVDSQNDQKFYEILKSSFNITDSVAILWAAFYLKYSNTKILFLRILLKIILFLPSLILIPFGALIFKVIPERLAGADIFWDLIEIAHNNKLNIFLLGAGPNIAKKTAKILKQKYHNLQIVGAEMGDDLRPEALLKKINQRQTNLLFVAYGAPKQEKWIANNLKYLNYGIVAIGVGGTFDFVSGHVKRAPLWLRKIGLEWFYRLCQEPKKRLKRIIKAIFIFPWLVFNKG